MKNLVALLSATSDNYCIGGATNLGAKVAKTTARCHLSPNPKARGEAKQAANGKQETNTCNCFLLFCPSHYRPIA
jgi:hypothetical protein